MATFCAFRTAAAGLVRPARSPSSSRIYEISTFIIPHVRYKTNLARHPRNDEIDYRVVQMVDPDTGRLKEPTELRDILASINRKTHFVELVSEEPNPIVKIKDKKEEYSWMKEKRARLKLANSIQQKEVQMTWGVASGDLAHKLKKVRRELEKGNRVDLVYAPKKDQALPSPLKIEERLRETVDLLADVGKEWRPRNIQRNIAILSFQGHSAK
jgi:translation initiation factor IF-3